MAGPSSWNVLPVDLRSSSSGLDTFAKHLKHIFLGRRILDKARIFEFILHLVVCDTVAVSTTQIIIIIIIDDRIPVSAIRARAWD